MTQMNLMRLSDLSRDNTYDGAGVYNPSGNTAYGYNGEKIGTVRDAQRPDPVPDRGRRRLVLLQGSRRAGGRSPLRRQRRVL